MQIRKGISGYMRLARKNHLPHEMIFFVTNRCNSSCEGCFYRDELNRPVDELSLDEIEKTSKSMGNFFTLMISGGEPFLRRDLPEICGIFSRNNRTWNIFIPTNGLDTAGILKLTESVLERCPDTKIAVGVSLDGMQETNDLIRGARGGFRKATRTLEGLISLKEAYQNLHVRVNTVVSSRNYIEIPRLMDFIRMNYDADFHSVSPMRSPKGMPCPESPTPGQWKSIYTLLLKYDRHYLSRNAKTSLSLRIRGKRRLYELIERSLSMQGWGFKCLAGNMIGVIEPNGDVKLCEPDSPIGNLRDHGYDFRKVWFSEGAESGRRKAIKCSCMHPCFLSSSLMYNPRTLYTILR
jgi:MoaA/NifB/PqqE/SkfB family radical SAM enzyme